MHVQFNLEIREIENLMALKDVTVGCTDKHKHMTHVKEQT